MGFSRDSCLWRKVGVLVAALVSGLAVPQGAPDVRWMRGGLSAPVTSVTVNHEGTLVAVCDSTVRVYNRQTGHLVKSLPWIGAHAVAFGDTHHGQLLAVKLNVGQVVLHRASDWSVLHVFPISDGSTPGQPFCFSRSGRFLITSRDAFYIPTLSPVVFSPPADYLLGIDSATDAGLFDDFVLARFGYYNLRTGSFVKAISTPDATHVSFSGEGRFVAPTGAGFRVYSTLNGSLIHTNLDGPAEQVQWAPDGEGLLVTAKSGGRVRLYRASDYGLLQNYNAHNDCPSPAFAQFTSNATHVVSGSREALSWRSDTTDVQSLTSHFLTSGAWMSLAYAPSGGLLASTALNGGNAANNWWDLGVKFWNPDNGDFLEPALDAGRMTSAIAFTSDGSRLIVASLDASGLVLYDVGSRLPSGFLPTPGSTRRLLVHPVGGIVASGQGWTRTFDEATGLPISTVSVGPNDITISGDGRLLAHTGPSGVVVRSIPSLDVVEVSPSVPGQTSEPECVAWAGDDVVFGYRALLVKWNRATGQISTLEMLGSPPGLKIASVAGSPDGRYVIVGGRDNQLRIVHVPTFETVATYDAEVGFYGASASADVGVSRVIFRPNVSEFAYARNDGSIVSARFPFPLSRTVRAAVSLQQFIGSPDSVSLHVEMRHPGSKTAEVSFDVTLSPTSELEFVTQFEGAWDISVKGDRWLRSTKRVTIGLNGVPNLVFALFGGDVNGDNAVSIADFLGLRASFGTSPGSANWNPNADLNGDGSVSIADFLILRQSFGRSGDA